MKIRWQIEIYKLHEISTLNALYYVISLKVYYITEVPKQKKMQVYLRGWARYRGAGQRSWGWRCACVGCCGVIDMTGRVLRQCHRARERAAARHGEVAASDAGHNSVWGHSMAVTGRVTGLGNDDVMLKAPSRSGCAGRAYPQAAAWSIIVFSGVQCVCRYAALLRGGDAGPFRRAGLECVGD